VPTDEIVAEVAQLVAGGVREVVLIAQDTGIWGRDLERAAAPGRQSGVPVAPGRQAAAPAAPGRRAAAPSRQAAAPAVPPPSRHPAAPAAPPPPSNLANLLELLAMRFLSTWFRVMYLQPGGITDELLAVMARHVNICDYLDIPLQHASARVLSEMNRAGSGEDYLKLLARIRAALPNVTLRTTVIAGFPGETRAEARELERFIGQAAFDYVGVFPYSQEEGTVAGNRADQVLMRTRRARAQRLRDLADAIGFAKVAARVGETEEVLVVEWDEDAVGDAYPLLGRTKRQAPEVDGMVHLDRGNIGKMVSATMVEAYCYELDGKVTGDKL
jgi:ribosomal protein S12 methylthiotransferase